MTTTDPTGAAAYVELRQVDKVFEQGGTRNTVLEGIDIAVRKGEFCAIVGPSGCGKSSILRLIDGIMTADSGTVRVDGRDVTGPSADIGLVFQQFNLLPWKTVLQNVLFGLEGIGLGKSERKERAQHWLEVVGLTGYEDYHPRQLSGGMQQRVSLARTMARDPSLVLMDEPFGALDALTRMYLQEEVVRLWESGDRTGILVTHDIEEALLLADRILVMSSKPGRISAVVDVPFKHPRGEKLRMSPEFAQLKDEIWRLLSKNIAERSPYARSRE
ncbi:MAG: nitrate transporter ATP-binding protein [Nocardioides sp.]|jgi:NitT/TauT family transport system ATP-binding protein|nr:nitrate transporter ATP-binding protein [Nocardioides sp.]